MTHQRGDRRYYLSDVPYEEALSKFLDALRAVGALSALAVETVPLSRARGRVTAEPVWARRSSPHYDSAAMDGVAVRSRETTGATETSPLRLGIGQQAVWVDTGDPVPDGFDAVIMIEVVHQLGDNEIEIYAPVAPYQHVRALGEDIVATELVLPENHILRPVDLGACAAAGLTELAVRKKPEVAIIPTGTELVPIGSEPKAGEIIEFNSLILGGLIEEWGADPTTLTPVPDDYDKLRTAVTDAISRYDVVIINAGSSAGSEDYTARLVEELGTLIAHGAAIRPGHPIVLSVVEGKPVMGIPGYPVSAALTCELFIKPLIEAMTGARMPRRKREAAVITRKVLSPMGEDEFLRVRLGRVGGRLLATPIQRGAGVIMSLVRADGLALIPRFSEGLDAGQEVDVELLRPIEEIEGTIVAIGSHDLTLDLLASMLRKRHPDSTLASSNVGSLGGLMALNRGEAHMAGTHLLDEETGEYNLSYVRRYVTGPEVVVMNLVHRVQGLIVPRGNPQKLATLDDLGHEGISFVNRQRGSGTRVLLDYKLKELNISKEAISGYEREEYTHLAVAAAVAGGKADVGLGILSAARAIDLDFVPLLSERYDLVIPSEYYQSELLQPLLDLINSDDFKSEVESLGGYDTSQTGTVLAEHSPGT
ncbi:MAG: molybdopterin biosynthesis protein [Chloroflexi bacterium]|nr:molybdopterin biosynthesis protein [Chloroflexota bacterium]